MKKASKVLLLILAVVLVSAFACGGGEELTPTYTSTPTTTPEGTVSATTPTSIPIIKSTPTPTLMHFPDYIYTTELTIDVQDRTARNQVMYVYLPRGQDIELTPNSQTKQDFKWRITSTYPDDSTKKTSEIFVMLTGIDPCEDSETKYNILFEVSYNLATVNQGLYSSYSHLYVGGGPGNRCGTGIQGDPYFQFNESSGRNEPVNSGTITEEFQSTFKTAEAFRLIVFISASCSASEECSGPSDAIATIERLSISRVP